jgi:hypothetical protein
VVGLPAEFTTDVVTFCCISIFTFADRRRDQKFIFNLQPNLNAEIWRSCANYGAVKIRGYILITSAF